MVHVRDEQTDLTIVIAHFFFPKKNLVNPAGYYTTFKNHKSFLLLSRDAKNSKLAPLVGSKSQFPTAVNTTKHS